MSSDPKVPTENEPDENPDTAPDAAPEEVEPAFDIDLEPDEQGLAGSGEEPSRLTGRTHQPRRPGSRWLTAVDSVRL